MELNYSKFKTDYTFYYLNKCKIHITNFIFLTQFNVKFSDSKYLIPYVTNVDLGVHEKT